MNTPSPFSHLSPAQQVIAAQMAREAFLAAQELEQKALQELEGLLLEADRRKCETLKGFVEYFWDVLEPTEALVWNWHLDELCILSEQIEQGVYDHVIANIPPGTMKSLLLSVFFRAKIWSKDPAKRFLSASYSSNLSVRDNVKLRTLIQHSKYKRLFPDVIMTGDQNAKEKFETTKGGWSLATSVDGAGTGEHPDFIFIDDPITEQQSRSKAERDTANNWIDGTISSRGLVRNVRVVLVMQRLHEEDPTGHLMSKGGWHRIVFPMRYEGVVRHPDGSVSLPDPRDHRTTPGELLSPSLFPEKKVRALEIALGPYGTAGQLQQRPSPEGGGLFQRIWFKFVEAAPVTARRARGWDTAATDDGGDWTVGCKIAEAKDLFYIEDVIHEQLGPASVDLLMKRTAENDGIACVQRELQEPAASGKTVIEARTKTLKGYDHKGVRATGDKVTMAKPLRAQCEAGNVYLVKTGDVSRDAWIEPFISELCTFPTGKNDDQVDGASCAFNSVLLEPVPEDEFVSW